MEVFGRYLESNVGGGIRRLQVRRLVGEDIFGCTAPSQWETSIDPTDFTPGIGCIASIMRLCIAGTLSPL